MLAPDHCLAPRAARWDVSVAGDHLSDPGTPGIHHPGTEKRPKSSYVRFRGGPANECWQADVTHWALADGTDVEILNFIDDHSRLVLVADVRRVTKGPDVLTTYQKACQRWGTPASVLTDKRCSLQRDLTRWALRL